MHVQILDIVLFTQIKSGELVYIRGMYLHPRRGAQCVNLKGNLAAPMW